jgi:arabinogalactan oligomer/maltooligosaccharide transport system permease protein
VSMYKERKKAKPGQRLILWVSRIVIWLFLLFAMIPILFVFVAALSPGQTFFSATLFPSSVTFSNFTNLIKQTDFLIWVRNSLIVSVILGIVQVFFSATTAYAFSRMKFWGRKYGLMTLLLLQMFPNFMAISAIYSFMQQYNLLDNLFAYILVNAGGSAYNIWLMKGYLDTLPKELDEAAVMDGAGSFQIYWRIILPLAKPMLTVIFLFSMIGSFGEFIFSRTLLNSPNNYTLAVGLFQFIRNQFGKNYTEFAAAALLSAVPITILFAVFQKWIASGLVSGSVKG